MNVSASFGARNGRFEAQNAQISLRGGALGLPAPDPAESQFTHSAPTPDSGLTGQRRVLAVYSFGSFRYYRVDFSYTSRRVLERVG